ncbi:MAG: type II methionyl aminopeptidase [Candidatus Altiarchaeota archaeon]
MEPEDMESYRQAGRIASEAREWSRKLVKPGARLIEIAESIESRIIENKAGLAFPVNVCVNDVAAHYTPRFNDELVLTEKDVVSVDLGVHVDGFIADTAYTIDLTGEYSKMLEANELALTESIEAVKPGLSVSAIGDIVQSRITSAGYRPIENLTGHEVKQYDLHAGLSVPNIKVPYDWVIEEGMVLALEPFATDGVGRVVESKKAEIFSLISQRPTRDREARKLLKAIDGREGLPFASRWYSLEISPLRLGIVLNKLSAEDILKSYPPLHERQEGVVSQFEHTIVVTSDGCEVTTA